MLNFKNTPIRDLYIVNINPFSDIRGEFSRLFCEKEFKEIGLSKKIVNANYSKTLNKGSVRGMHYQESPYGETKIIKCINGIIYDVAIDMRKNSQTYLQYFGIELSQDNNTMLYVPEGFAHGFQALTDNAEIVYFNTQFYSPEHEKGVNIIDPSVGIRWPISIGHQSDKDKDINFLR
jgi:dTDP-4-dehydrorhamnose 3,5-epimerase